MPANPKHLTKSPWQQFAKLSAGIIGGYIISALFHMALALWLPLHKEIIISSTFTLFIVWCAFLIIAYLFKSGWKAWGLYILLIISLYILYFFGNQNNPFI